MKRLLALLAVIAAIVLGGAVPANASATLLTISSFDAHYELSRDAGGHSQLKTVETIVASFPDGDVNHGIVRDLVTDYDGHPTGLDITSVTDEAGTPLTVDTSYESGYEELKIGDADTYVHGEHTYVITYTQSNVTAFFADSNDDEFYWNVNGTQWAQSMDSVTATVTVAPDLVSSLTGTAKAFAGFQGQTDVPATISSDGGTFTVSASNLTAAQNLSFAIGFTPHTFTPRADGFFDAPWPSLGLLTLFLGLLGVVGALVLRRTKLADAKGRGIIVPEYTPPKDASLAMATVILGRKSKYTSAQIIQLAVNGNLRIVEESGSRRTNYRLDYVSDKGTVPDTAEFLHALFGNTLTPGETHDLTTNSTIGARKIADIMTRVTADATLEGYRKRLPLGWLALIGLGSFIVGALTLVFTFASLSTDFGGNLPYLFVPAAIVLFLVTIGLVARKPLAAKGVELRDYLKGLMMYIDLAEEDRLRYLQSPQGAERTPIPTEDKASVLKLNEKLLPYAVLFGNEKQWASELGKYYEDTGSAPGWYSGSNAFSAFYFASAIGSLNASSASAFTVPTSSSSGGTGGGGFSGGGGGGGGGGGW